MDNTEENITMCEKAEEIQNSWRKRHGDYYLSLSHSPSQRGVALFHSTYFVRPDENIDIWLPRQDQLQKMVFEYLAKGNDTYSIFTLILDFSDFANQPCGFDSMEQLWLAFVMRELYNKVWNGSEWKEEEVKVLFIGGIRVKHRDIK